MQSNRDLRYIYQWGDTVLIGVDWVLEVGVVCYCLWD